MRQRSSTPSRTPTAPCGPLRCWPASAAASSSPSNGSDVDLKKSILHVRRSYDPTSATFGRPKSKHGIRTVPITAALTPHLADHALRSGRRRGLVFGRTPTSPLDSRRLQVRADEAWQAADLSRVTLHACRHLYASMSIAAGVNAHALCKYMGHSGIQVTFDLYGHLFPGNEAEARTARRLP
jgi:integrase